MNLWLQPDQQLRMEGYEIALDNFVPDDTRQNLIPFANYLKIDIRRVVEQHCAALVVKHGANCIMIAQKVETRLQFIAALKDGFTLFQGYFSGIPSACGPETFPRTKPASCGS